MKNSTSLSDFKKNLRGQERKSPVYFYFGNRAAQIYHTRLQLEFSSLNSHLFKKKNLIDSPRCSCGQIETVIHYLFDCTNYTQLRHQASSDVLHLLVNNLISGNSNLSIEENM